MTLEQIVLGGVVFIVLFDLILWLINRRISELVDSVDISNDIDRDMWRLLEETWLPSIHKKLKNGRERDVKLLRVLRELQNDFANEAVKNKDLVLCTHKDIEVVAKECRSIKSVVGQAKNVSLELKESVLNVQKFNKNMEPTIKSLNETLEKAKKGRK